MGSGGRAIGPDGKLIQRPQQQQQKNGPTRGGRVQQQPRGMARPMRVPPHLIPGMPPMVPGMPPRAPGVQPRPLMMTGPMAPLFVSGPPSFPGGGSSYGFFGNNVPLSSDAKVSAPSVAPEPVKAPAPAVAKAPEATVPASHVGEVPGFGTNSSIHELFGKMVWRKMEGLKDPTVVDRLQNRIMNLIHDALSDQAASGTTAAPPGATGTFRTF